MKYKIGDKVRVKSWDKMVEKFGVDEEGDINTEPCFVKSMKQYCGEIMTIKEVFGNGVYRLSDGGQWGWSDDMLEEVEGNKITNGNISKITHLPKNGNDFNAALRAGIKQKYGTCPFCSQNKLVRIFDEEGVYHQMRKGRYGRARPLLKHIFSKPVQWYYYDFSCNNCGAEWKSEEFPEIKIKGVESKPVNLWDD